MVFRKVIRRDEGYAGNIALALWRRTERRARRQQEISFGSNWAL